MERERVLDKLHGRRRMIIDPGIPTAPGGTEGVGHIRENVAFERPSIETCPERTASHR